MSDATLSTLVQIQNKIRRLVRAPSEVQITTQQINDYINTFVLYDFPEHLRLFNLRTTLTFYTQPYIDVYETNTTNPADPLFNFINLYTSVAEPVYIAGFRALYTQSREQFFNIYPLINSIGSIGTSGDGVTTHFTGTLSAIPIIRNYVTFASVTNANTGLRLSDDGLGNLTGDGTGTIDYVTGAFVLDFSTPPGSGMFINSETIPTQPAQPRSLLFFDNKFTVRPIPDQPYPVQLEAYKRPDELLANNQQPKLSRWWQYIAYGAAKKIFEDRMDLDSVALILPEFKQQERMVLRDTLVLNANERTATIYTEQAGGPSAYGWNFSGPF
jgi:hypothetical protein